MKKMFQIVMAAALIASLAHAENNSDEQSKPPQRIEADIKVPYERPIGFTYNLGSIVSMTFEGRFLLGIWHNFTFVASPSVQIIPELPFPPVKNENWSAFGIKRFNLGLGIRTHFYEYDSLDGFFIEAMGRPGMTWVGEDPFMWSVIPSLIFGYSTVYESGYSVSFGLGVEWEFLIGEATGHHTEFLKTNFYGVSKLPFTGELSIGWTW